MGWLFGRKKKVPKVPFPEPHAADEKVLKFPGQKPLDKVIEPEKVQEAAGVKNKPEERGLPELPELPGLPDNSQEVEEPEEGPEQPERQFPPRMPPKSGVPPPMGSGEPLFIKLELYKRMLGEIDDLHKMLNELGGVNRSLESSEYNEENNFMKLRRSTKGIHDRLLQLDKILFKPGGE